MIIAAMSIPPQTQGSGYHAKKSYVVLVAASGDAQIQSIQAEIHMGADRTALFANGRTMQEVWTPQAAGTYTAQAVATDVNGLSYTTPSFLIPVS